MSTTIHSEAGEFTKRLLQQLMAEALPVTWLRRAEQLEQARPRRGDFTGRASRAELKARDARLSEQAAACRLHALFLTEWPSAMREQINGDVQALLEEVAIDGAQAA